ncbi:BON domain-containing protein [Frateuria soli]|uniref:BON domain-containing protein n=1 Tax=Frateuria soli TaxID=1542730 RepID=UPI001E32CB92|nr:BON domain-containing protein [Frateuria soli]UGB39612.1 BON domain-containing protein [Frateuria soli]
MNDVSLRYDVLEELDYEPSLDATNIAVMAKDGVVTLTGHVASYAEKLAAERAAWRVHGVKAIAQKLQVELPGDRKLSDDDIARRALNILAWDVLAPSERIHVRVSDGWVTLTGEVPWNYQREAAEADMRKLSGVTGVSNDILVTPRVQPGDVRKSIVDALKRHAEVEAKRIKVDVRENGTVAIEGQVDDWEERQAVERAAWSAPGVRAVENRVRIV